MSNIYVDELPKNRNECKFQVFIANYKNGWQHKERYCSIMKNNYDCICSKENCPLKPLSDRLAEERKKVVGELKVDIRSLFNSYASSLIDYCIWNKNADENQKLYNNFKRIINDRLVKVLDLFDKRIDQIERVTDD